MTRGRRRAAIALTVGMLLAAGDAALAMRPPAPSRWALVVSVGEAARAPTEAIAQSLRVTYGFPMEHVVELHADRATDKAIHATMDMLAGKMAGESDVLFLLVTAAREGASGLHFAAADSKANEPWTWPAQREVLDWVRRLRVGTALLIHGGCSAPSTSTSGLDSGPVTDILTYCEPPGPGAAGGVSEKGAAAFADALRAVLQDAGTGASRALTSETMQRRLQAKLVRMRVRLWRPPIAGREGFTLIPSTGSVATLRARFARAASQADREEIVSAAAVGAQKDPTTFAADAVKFLTDVARDPAVELAVRSRAVSALGDLKLPAAQAALASVASDANGTTTIREAAVAELTDTGNAAAVRPILNDPDPRIRTAAARTAGVLRDVGACDRLVEIAAGDPNLDARLAAIESISNTNRDVDRPRVAALLADPAPEVRRSAASALARMGLGTTPEVDRALIARLREDDDSSVRAAAAYALARVPDEPGRRDEAEAALIAALAADSEQLRRAAAFALGIVDGPRAGDALLEALRRKPDVAVIEALGKLRVATAVDDLRRALHDPNDGVRRAAVTALGAIGTEPAVAALFEALKDPNPYVRDAARNAIDRTGQPSRDVLEERGKSDAPQVRSSVLRKIAQTKDGATVDTLIQGLSDPNAEVRQTAINGLGAQRDDESVERIASLLDSNDATVRVGAAAALARIPSPRAREALRKHATDRDPQVRAAVIRALADNPDDDGRRLFQAASTDPDPEVRKAAAEGLARSGSDESKRALRSLATGDRSPEVRALATERLREQVQMEQKAQ
jgi:HEAT repeat protein